MSYAVQLGLSWGSLPAPYCSPFSFINELAITVTDKGTHRVQFVQDMAQVFLLPFANDVTLLSVTPSGLQKQWDYLKAEADRCLK